jgi:hypothetical protein
MASFQFRPITFGKGGTSRAIYFLSLVGGKSLYFFGFRTKWLTAMGSWALGSILFQEDLFLNGNGSERAIQIWNTAFRNRQFPPTSSASDLLA